MFHRQDEASREKEIPTAQQQVPHSKFHAEIHYEMMPWAVSHALFQTFLRKEIKIKLGGVAENLLISTKSLDLWGLAWRKGV